MTDLWDRYSPLFSLIFKEANRNKKVLGEVGKLPDIFTELEINFFLLRRLLGVKAEGDAKQTRV